MGRIETGAVVVNDALVNAAMGGWKTSGVGSRHGAHGIRKYCRTQTIVTQRFTPRRVPNGFPYSARRTRLLAQLVRLAYGR